MRVPPTTKQQAALAVRDATDALRRALNAQNAVRYAAEIEGWRDRLAVADSRTKCVANGAERAYAHNEVLKSKLADEMAARLDARADLVEAMYEVRAARESLAHLGVLEEALTADDAAATIAAALEERDKALAALASETALVRHAQARIRYLERAMEPASNTGPVLVDGIPRCRG